MGAPEHISTSDGERQNLSLRMTPAKVIDVADKAWGVSLPLAKLQYLDLPMVFLDRRHLPLGTEP